ncbi:MAG: DUF4230 domain-containing protein [Prevotellaceae bacterium]|nr:DUF4230 domain-containing protein [Candidatus Minthosoma caballi]
MKEKAKEILELIANFFIIYSKWIWRIAIVFITFIAGIVITLLIANGKNSNTEIVIEDSPLEIQEIRPKGDIVVCSAIMEDYAPVRETEHHLFTTDEQHTCAQLLTQKCCYKINLDKVEYIVSDSTKTVLVKIPEPEYKSYTQSSEFISDDEEFWAEALPSTNDLKKKVEQQIMNKFCTPANKRKAERYAEDAITNVLKSVGYEAEFIHSLDKGGLE